MEQNLFKAYEYILGFCNKTMKSRIKKQVDYDVRIKGNVRALLKKISSKMYDPARAKYKYLLLMQPFKQLLNTRQEEEESLIDYTKQFKQVTDNFGTVIRKNILDNFVKNTKEYKEATMADEKQTLVDNSYST